jgi:hypothetical protein
MTHSFTQQQVLLDVWIAAVAIYVVARIYSILTEAR